MAVAANIMGGAVPVKSTPIIHPIMTRLRELEGADPIPLSFVKFDDSIGVKSAEGPYNGDNFKSEQSLTLSQMTDNGGWILLFYPRAGYVTIQHSKRPETAPVPVHVTRVIYSKVASQSS